MESDEKVRLKRCRACGEEKPATTDYFEPIQGGKYLNSYCHQCKPLVRKAQYEDGGREDMKLERLRRIEAGLCAKCGKVPPLPGSKTCEPCRIKQQEANARLRARRKADPEASATKLEKQRRYYADHPEQYAQYRRKRQPADALARPAQRLRKYNLTIPQRDQRLEQQGWRCAICGVDLRVQPRYVIDHCKDNKTLRGILCDPCNLGLGHFFHSVPRLRAAIRYLQKSVWIVEADSA